MTGERFGIIGLGYVGLPLAHAAVTAGMKGVGLDQSEEVVEALCRGTSHIDDVDDASIELMLAAGFTATSDAARLADTDVIVICVPTPLSDRGGPDLSFVVDAAHTAAAHMAPGTLVVLESTTWPGTTEEVVLPILEAEGRAVGEDFFLAFSPERIDPGNTRFGVKNTPKVVGGVTSACAKRAEEFYRKFVDEVVLARGTREAEMAKLLENTYRQVNIALVNEMAKFSHQLDIDFWDVIRCASTKPFGFAPFYPGPGVGGHCIPIDPSYLSHQVQARLGYPFRFVELAQEVNRSMPIYVASRASQMLNDQAKPTRGSTILLLGVTYKAGVSDQRESPAVPLAKRLHEWGAEVLFYDPYVEEWGLDSSPIKRTPLAAGLSRADLVIHLQPHRDYSVEVLNEASVPVLDTRGSLDGLLISRL